MILVPQKLWVRTTVLLNDPSICGLKFRREVKWYNAICIFSGHGMAKISNKPATEISEMKLAKGSKLLESKGLSKTWANHNYQHDHKSIQIPINNQIIRDNQTCKSILIPINNQTTENRLFIMPFQVFMGLCNIALSCSFGKAGTSWPSVRARRVKWSWKVLFWIQCDLMLDPKHWYGKGNGT